MKKILLVFGTRPEAIKMAPIVKELEKNTDKFQTFVCVTGQHRQMLDQVLQLFEIKPDYDLNIMQPNQDLYDITSRILLGLRDVLKEVQPDLVFVHGDTTTSTIAALAAFYQQIPVIHIEAGLRTHNIYSPWPEEMNRQLTGRLTTYHMAPTQKSKENLLKENIDEQNILVTGNTVIDALHFVVEKLKSDDNIQIDTKRFISNLGYNVNRLNEGRKLILITGHRRENFGCVFFHICEAIKDLSEQHPEVDFVYPVHLNPNVQKPVYDILGGQTNDNVFLTSPLDYLPFVYLMSHSYLILTDSGGVQEEAPGLGKPVLVMRDTTERPEAVEAGTVRLVGIAKEKIIEEVSKLLNDKQYYTNMSQANNPYGNGFAAKRIVNYLATKI